MYTYKILENADVPILYRAFIDAFSDYQVKLNLLIEVFCNMLKRRGFAPDYSVGAFTESGDQLVGFILNGLRSWRGALTVYDLGAGVIPSHRKKGISRNLFRHVQKVMEQNHINRYLLESLQENTAALELYKSMGLSITRDFSCFRLEKSAFLPVATQYEVHFLSEIHNRQWEYLRLFWDFEPSLQNSIDSIGAVKEEFAYSVIY